MLFQTLKTNKINILGMMSGTSADGIDGALVEYDITYLLENYKNIDGRQICDVANIIATNANYEIDITKIKAKLIWHEHYNYENAIQNYFLDIMTKATSKDVMYGHSLVAQLYYEAYKHFISKHPSDKNKIVLISAHGQTIEHDPNGIQKFGYLTSGSLQLLDGCLLAEKCQLPVLYDFRKRDIAVGGQGAPLVPFGDLLFFSDVCKNCIVVLNIGGISNFTVIQNLDNRRMVTSAFDVGPGNTLMDALASRVSNRNMKYDIDGRIASKGKIINALLDELMQDEFIHKNPPKSTGKDKFGKKLEEKIWRKYSSRYSYFDIMATYSAFTVESIKHALENYVLPHCRSLDEVIVAGGGALNNFLMENLEKKLNSITKVSKSDKYGIPIMAREAMAFSALGLAFLLQVPSNIPVATGATKKVCLGILAPKS